MKLSIRPFILHKKFPLTISRGTSRENTNLWLILEADGLEGWGEATPFSITQEGYQNSQMLLQEFQKISYYLEKYHPLERQKIRDICLKLEVSSAIRAAIDMALYDWLGKRADLPLWRLWGLDREKIVPLSVTVGIGTPEAAKQRVKNWLEVVDAKIIKVKLGAKEGIEADQGMLLAIKQAFPEKRLTVDANGGWNLEAAITMANWLATQEVEYIEQPLAVGQEKDLQLLKQRSPLPIFLDESCFNSQDILQLAPYMDGINIKIMKAGGLTEVKKMIYLAQSCGLKIMFGCYSDSSLANTAMCHLAPLADYLDLDSHLNLVDDPFRGAIIQQGCLIPNNLPGLGVNFQNQ